VIIGCMMLCEISNNCFSLRIPGCGQLSKLIDYVETNRYLRISAIVDTCFSLIVDGVSVPSWTRRGCAQARG
jgi:hypothetical protein